MKILAKLSHEETKKVYNIIEKKLALENLEKCLVGQEKKNELYIKCKKEKEEIELQYEKWWDYMICKYQLQDYPYAELTVDAIGETIQLV